MHRSYSNSHPNSEQFVKIIQSFTSNSESVRKVSIGHKIVFIHISEDVF